MSLSNLFFNTLNVVMRPLLRTGVMKANLCILRYEGRKSGKQYKTPLSYVREGEVVRLLSSYNTRWWTNFVAESRPVEVEIAGERQAGSARAITADSEAFRDGVRRFLTALPRGSEKMRLVYNKLVLILTRHTLARAGLANRLLDRHEVVTIDGDVVTLGQATP